MMCLKKLVKASGMSMDMRNYTVKTLREEMNLEVVAKKITKAKMGDIETGEVVTLRED